LVDATHRHGGRAEPPYRTGVGTDCATGAVNGEVRIHDKEFMETGVQIPFLSVDVSRFSYYLANLKKDLFVISAGTAHHSASLGTRAFYGFFF